MCNIGNSPNFFSGGESQALAFSKTHKQTKQCVCVCEQPNMPIYVIFPKHNQNNNNIIYIKVNTSLKWDGHRAAHINLASWENELVVSFVPPGM